jgi:hypothetical protein
LIEADANKQNSTPKEEWDYSAIDPSDAPRAVKEYLDVLDPAAFGAASEFEPKFTSHSDPASQCLSVMFTSPAGERRQPVKALHSSVIPPTTSSTLTTVS